MEDKVGVRVVTTSDEGGTRDTSKGQGSSCNGVEETLPKGDSTCKICSAPAEKSCSACQIVKYCCAAHQKEDWPRHKKNCTPFILKTNPGFGRHLVAARKLKAGSLIIEEVPLLCAPRGLVEDFSTPICLSCCVLMEDEKSSYRCSKCNWPTCCWTCEQNKLHAQNECKILSGRKIPYPPPCEYPVYVAYKVIEILRGVLLKEENPETWSKIMNLQHRTELGHKIDLFQDLPKLRESFGVEDIGLEEDWRRMLGVLNVNNFSMEGRRGGYGPSFTGYVFLQSSMLAHSCSPNCWWGVSMFPNMKIQVRTTVDVLKGEPLTVPYSYMYNAFGTHKRQELIQSDGEFVCKCVRCMDSTELDSFTSALICGTCKNGHVLPLTPTIVDSEWQCQDSNCKTTLPWVEVNDVIENLMTKLEECDTVPDMEKFVEENRGVSVHSNHWLITEAEEVMCQQRTQSLFEDDDISLEDRDAHISLCEHLLTVKNIIAPGFSLERGRLLNRLARARFERLDAIVKNKTLTDSDEISAEADFIYLLYDEALNFYKHDITETTSTEKYAGLKCRMIMSDMELVKERFPEEVGNIS